jgi:hypothetical protein
MEVASWNGIKSVDLVYLSHYYAINIDVNMAIELHLNAWMNIINLFCFTV